MSARVIALRPRPRPGFRAVLASSSGSSSAVPPVRVGWDSARLLNIAHCERCTESFTSSHPSDLDDWADTHRCDAELAALLALVTTRRAA